MLYFFPVNTFSCSRIALIDANNTSKDRLLAVDGTSVEAFMNFFFILKVMVQKQKLRNFQKCLKLIEIFTR